MVSAAAVALYVALGGLRSAIFNEVLQFVLIWGGALLVPILGLVQAGGWSGLKAADHRQHGTRTVTSTMWRDTGHFAANPMGVHWTGIVFGLGFVISFGYWTTDFLVVQRVLAAHNLRAARMAPIIGSFFKMAVPFIVILPGLLGLVLLQNPDGSRMQLVGEDVVKSCAASESDQSHGRRGMLGGDVQDDAAGRLPAESADRSAGDGTAQLQRSAAADDGALLGPGLLGLGITALIAGFMSGMAGNVSAFSTVWTYDIYKPLINKKGSDSHYVLVGRWSILIGVVVSIGAGYLVQHAHGIMDYVQALFSFFIAPLLGAILLGMFWKRATAPAGFLGLLIGIVSSVEHVCLGQVQSRGVCATWRFRRTPSRWPRICIAHCGPSVSPRSSSSLVSLVTKPKPVAELDGLSTAARFCPRKSRFRSTRTNGSGRCWRCASLLRSTSCSGNDVDLLRREERITNHAWFRNSHLVFHWRAAARSMAR